MILSDLWLKDMLDRGLIEDPDYSLINPASIDIRVGYSARVEVAHGSWEDCDLRGGGLILRPGTFANVATLESFDVPNGYALDLRLKSTTARRGLDHSLAFWVDPGWKGVLTMELRNVLQYNAITLSPGDRIAQVIVHRLTGPAERPYSGRYQGAKNVEGAKI